MSDHPKISIISTVYNTGPYLRPAVESILAQTFTDFELLLVDDGSHDGSAEVCDALAGQDARIRVFHQPNGGPAHARNTGLDNACGDYIGIVDSDDLIEPAMFETLYNAVQQPGVRLAACAADCMDAEEMCIRYSRCCDQRPPRRYDHGAGGHGKGTAVL